MSDHAGPASDNGSSSPEKKQLQPPAGSRYTDREDPALKDSRRARGSYDLDLDDGDIELGDLPLLTGESEGRHGDSGSFDLDAEDIQFRHDPSFSCMPSGFVAWLRGPSPPHVYHINPWFPRWQAAPARLIERWVPSKYGKFGLLLGVLVFWMLLFFPLLQRSTSGEEVLGYGQPVKLSCHHRLWYVVSHCC